MSIIPDPDLLGQAVLLLMDWRLLYFIGLGTFIGIVVGALPGLSSVVAIGVSLPFTYYMEPMQALVFLTAIYTGGLYAGGVTSVLLNIPGTSAAIATGFDGYPMTLSGRAKPALGIQLGSSAVGGLFGYLAAFLVLPVAGGIALKFGPPEILVLALLAIILVGAISGSIRRSLILGTGGLLLGTIGATAYGTPRGTMGLTPLYDGLPLIPVLMGLLAISELFVLVEREYVIKKPSTNGHEAGSASSSSTEDLGAPERSFVGYLWYPFRNKKLTLQSGIIGAGIGMLPAAGSTIASLVSHTQGRRFARHPERYGKGEPEGVVAAETANNASEGGALAVMMSLGIPGSAASAMIMAAFLVHGLVPGPYLMRDNADLAYGLIIANMAGMVVLVLVGSMFVRYFTRIITFPTRLLVPVIAVLAVAGTISLRNIYMDAVIMVVFGLVGYIVRKFEYPIVALMLGVILGPLLDGALVRTISLYGGAWSGLLARPMFVSMCVLMFLAVLSSYARRIFGALHR